MIKLTVVQLKEMLKVSDKLLEKALAQNDTQRMYELLNYKSMVKDMLIEALEHELELQAYSNLRKAA